MHTPTGQKNLLKNSRALIASALFLWGVFFPNSTFAFGEIQITEINYRGYTEWADEESATASDEYITITNTTSEEILLTDYTLRVVSGSSDKTIILSGTLSESLILRKVTQAQKDDPNLPETLSSAELPSLHNSQGAYLELRDSQGMTVDSVNMYGSWSIPTERGEVLEKTKDGVWQVKSIEGESLEPEISPDEDEAKNPQSYSNLIQITELLPNPVGLDSQGEFVELLNISDQLVPLEGWVLDDIADGGSSPQSLDGEVAPGARYLLKKPELTISLNNSGAGIDAVRIIDPTGQVQDEASYALEEVQEGWSWSLYEGIFQWTQIPTPGEMNIGPLPIQSDPNEESEEDIIDPQQIEDIPVGSIKISEVLPYPIGGSEEEFIELYNTTLRPISLEGWALGDLGKTVSVAGYIPARSYRIFSFLETRIYLNNAGETVSLFEPNETLHDQVVIPKAPKGLSFIPVGNTWDWTESVTRGFSNQLVRSIGGDKNGSSSDSEDEYKVITNFTELADLQDEDIIQVQGWVISEIDQIFSSSLYISDGNRGVRVRIPASKSYELSLGEGVLIQGEWHTSETQSYLIVDNLSSIPVRLRPLVQAQSVSSDEWGREVQFSGTLVGQSGSSLELTIAEQEVPVKLANSIEKPKMSKGDTVSGTGMIEVYRGSHRILVFSQDSISVQEPLEPVESEEVQDQSNISLAEEDLLEYQYINWDTFALGNTFEEDSRSVLERLAGWIQWVPWQLRESQAFLMALAANITWWALNILRIWIRR